MQGAQRVVLGTVQLGKPYGRRAGQPLMSVEEGFGILDAAWALGIRTFDTAEVYGEASARLAAWLDTRGTRSDAAVVTKARGNDSPDLAARLEAALGPFHDTANLTLLSHGAVEGDLWDRFRGAAKSVGAEAGQSVYTGGEVQVATATPGVARIQAPGNLFDTRALEARGRSEIPLDLRSIYLQGVLLERPEDADRRAPGSRALADAVQRAAAEVGESPAALLIAAVTAQLAPMDRVVVGVDRRDELDTLRDAFTIGPDVVERFRRASFARLAAAPGRGTLDPRTWPS